MEREATIQAMTVQARAQLGEVLRAGGASVELAEAGFRVGGALTVACEAFDFRRYPYEEGALAALAFRAWPGAEQAPPLEDTVAGQAAALEGAVQEAVALWVEGVWPVLQSAYLPDPPPLVPSFSLSTMDYASRQPRAWRLWAGPLQTVGAPALAQQLESSPPLPLLHDALLAALEASEPRRHWLRLFLSRQAEGDVWGEVRLDNQPWPTGLAALAAFDWPTLPHYAAFRQFLLIEPESP